MNDVFIAALFAAAIAGLVTNLLVPLVIRVAHALKALSEPGGRNEHSGQIPRLGGLAIFSGIGIGAGGVAVIQWGQRSFMNDSLSRSELVALGLGIGLVFLVGMVDDLMRVAPIHKILVQLTAAWLLVWIGWSFDALTVPWIGTVHLGVWGNILALLWIVGVTNAINLVDGLDGLAGGVVAIISASLLVYALLQGNLLTVILLAALVGSCLGFLRHNWSPARIFMGDSGSLTLGFVLAAVSLHSSLKAPAAVAILVPLLALGLPVADTLLVMGVRFFERPQGGLVRRLFRMFRADRNHLHHLLLQTTPKRQKIVPVLYATVFFFCLMALAVAVTNSTSLGLALLIVEFLVVLGMRELGLVSSAKSLAKQQRQEVAPALRPRERLPERRVPEQRQRLPEQEAHAQAKVS